MRKKTNLIHWSLCTDKSPGRNCYCLLFLFNCTTFKGSPQTRKLW